MSDEYDDRDREGGSGFVVGLLTGTVLGAGLGMLFAPKAGSELRGQISDGASKVSRTASDGYHKAADAANTIAERSREYYGRARDAVSRGAEEVKRYSDEAQQKLGGESRSQGTEPRGSEVRTPGGFNEGRGGGI